MKNILNVTFIIIGVILGAGFASGKEIYIFFNQYGKLGIIGIIISFTFLGAIIYQVIKITNKYEINNYEELLEKIGTKNSIIKAIINIFLLMSFYIMIAGFSAYVEQEIKLPKIVGSLLIIILCYLIFTKNINGIIKANTILVPILIIFIIIFGIKNININYEIKNTIENENNIKFIISAILYASYNSITLVPMIVTIRKLVKTNKQNKIIFLILTIITILLALIIYNLLLKIDIDINKIELPTIYIANKSGTIYKYIYGIIILVSIFTTAISDGYGFLQNNAKNNKQYKILNILMCISSIFISNIGFSKLLNILYPLFGVLGLIQIYRIFAISLEKKRQN